MTIKMKDIHFIQGKQIHKSSKTPFQGEKIQEQNKNPAE